MRTLDGNICAFDVVLWSGGRRPTCLKLTCCPSLRGALKCSVFSRHQTPTQIAEAMDIASATVKSHIDWLEALTDLNPMRPSGDWWQQTRKDWLCEYAAVAGLEVGIENSATGDGAVPIKRGPIGGLTT